MKILTLCTGNVARSVMLGYMLADLAEANGLDWSVRSAGTHVTEGLAMSARTRSALLSIPELGEHRYGQHRSHQITASDVDWADIILTAESEHVTYVRRHYGEDVACVSLGHFVSHAPSGVSVSAQLGVLRDVAFDAVSEVRDPAGGEQRDYDACAHQLWELAQRFAEVVESIE